jgi:hypothetical protein
LKDTLACLLPSNLPIEQKKMARHQNPPFRAEHLGSLLRSDALVQKRDELSEGKIAREELIPLEDHDIKEIVAKQKELGFPAITDGEYRRHSKFPVVKTFVAAESIVELCTDCLGSVLGLFLPQPRRVHAAGKA